MKREIKFRGKSLKKGRWCYGGIVATDFGGGRVWIVSFEYLHGENNQYCATSETEVDPKTVGEFTGCFDKKGKGIYEGDICKQLFPSMDEFGFESEDKTEQIDAVEFKDAQFEINGYPLYVCVDFDIEVIGNIYEKPELIK